jgi:predicted nuclease with TOPRIM domain
MQKKINEITSYEEAEREIRKIWREIDKLEESIINHQNLWIMNEDELKRKRGCIQFAEKIDELNAENENMDEMIELEKQKIVELEKQVDELRSLHF